MIELIVALLLVASGALVLTAAVGLWRLPDFFLRLHAPAMASTLGAWLVALATVLHFSAPAQAPSLQAWLVIVLLSITAPVSTVVLARAALFRRRQAGDPLPPPLRSTAESGPAPRTPETPEP
ncbi:monovalent cation/H(+) antiporter subunit G [Ideonella sp. BN130291]|uniref:monovalent cation/H(+) antiporter subunit G n=1 Tax=Ideonella sp. BN130291 TaxID=3112940 RepID=UPI002E26B543|nr:monovalent cation/H(+) antiporter subunit G [Ideonella sp. BN130291]